MRAPLSAIGLAFLVGGAGCSGPALHPVHGVVTQDGKPVKGGVIGFKPVGEENPRYTTSALVGLDGKYSLTTMRSGADRPVPLPGAPAGDYTVTYTPLPASDGAAPPEPIRAPMIATVKPGDNDIPVRVSKP